MDRLRTMSVFVAVADEYGFAPAARRLNMSPPAVTRAVADLEAHLGSRLLHRTTRTLKLTEAGRRYREDCKRILADIDEADRNAAGIHAAPKGTVLLTAPVMFGRLQVTPVLLDLLQEYPDITVRTLFVDRVVSLIDEGVDVAVRIAELPDSSLPASHVGAVRRVVCASPSYLARRGRPRTLDELHEHDIIDFSSAGGPSRWAFEGKNGSETFSPEARLVMNVADAAISAASTGHGITRVLSYMVAPLVEQGILEIILEDHEPTAVPIHVVHKEPGQTSARVRAVVDYLIERLRSPR